MLPFRLQAGRERGSNITGGGARVVSVWTCPRSIEPFGGTMLVSRLGVELGNDISLDQAGDLDSRSINQTCNHLMKPDIILLLLKISAEGLLLERDCCNDFFLRKF